ncbi:uroporphyrinogen-III C-methyltransferase [Hydrocarboniphaga sp.]|uniref:uroporphyrinogen-III C-methyltransferase n=1 Tax=Hydrocarboniphaga sp. TaxID=2033016 RepID=UPI003D0A152D
MKKPSLPLKGLRVIVTRPDLQAGNLALLLEAQGAEAARLPLFAIEASGDDEVTRGVLQAHRDDDGWIFTSANAVRYAAEIDEREADWPTLFAVGGATAAALANAGHPGAISPDAQASSETLLQLPQLRQVADKKYLIVTGEDGRELIASELAARGARVDTLSLYRRKPVEHDEARVEAEVAMADVIVITSGETLDRLWRLTPDALRSTLLALQLVVPSPRVLEKALALGFTAPLLPETVSDDAIVRCLSDWRTRQIQDSSMSSPKPPELAAVPETGSDTGAAAAGAPTPPPPKASAQFVHDTPQAAAKSSSGIVAWLLVLVLAAALGYGGWLAWDLRANQSALLQAQDHALRRLSRQTAELDNLASQTATRQSDLARVLQRSGSDLAAMQGRLDNSEQLMGRMTEELQGGRTRFALASVEQLILLANDRLLLEHDVRAALLALQIADERLGALNDPRLFKTREAIARERTQLASLPRPDLTSASLTLSSLIDRADALPLRARLAPRVLGGPRSGNAAGDDAGSRWYERVWSAIRDAASGLFVIRREDNAASLRLLPAEDEAVLVHVLILKLESARVALLRGETASFREALSSAGDWLRQFFRADDPGVEAAIGEMERLQALELSAPPPDLTESLALLRQVLAPAAQP